MPTCKKCETEFPNHLEIDGKVRNLGKRSYCLTCSPFNTHNTRPLTDKKLFCIVCDTELTGNQRKFCSKGCNSKYNQENQTRIPYGQKSETQKQRMRDVSKRSYENYRSKLTEYFNDTCVLCKRTKEERTIIYHKKDGVEHSRSLRYVFNNKDDFAQLCQWCHRTVHTLMELKNWTWIEIENFIYEM